MKSTDAIGESDCKVFAVFGYAEPRGAIRGAHSLTNVSLFNFTLRFHFALAIGAVACLHFPFAAIYAHRRTGS
jgi:hypothetical protein